MKIIAEKLYNTNQVLLRLLSDPTGEIQAGSYLVDGRPQIPEPLVFDIDAASIFGGESRLYLTGFYPPPPSIQVQLPDSTTSTVRLASVLQPPKEELLARQPIETGTPDVYITELLPGESAGTTLQAPVETVAPPVFPNTWLELNFQRSSQPLLLSPSMEAAAGLIYQGGCEGRALSAQSRQPGPNVAPYSLASTSGPAPTRLEGSYSNLLNNADYYPLNPTVNPGLFDPLPLGWDLQLSNPLDLIRINSDSGGVVSLPTLTLVYTSNQQFQSMNNPCLAVKTPPVPAGTAFQILADPGSKNRHGSLCLQSEDGAVSTGYVSLDGGAQVLRLDLGTHGGRVNILWKQDSNNNPQVLKLIAPLASSYGGPHGWVPTGKTSEADLVQVPTLTFDQRWNFTQGSISVESQTNSTGQPFSWELLLGGSARLLSLSEGLLSSDFDTSGGVNLGAVLAGNYRLRWNGTSGWSFVNEDENPVALPVGFGFTLPIPSNLLSPGTPLSLTLRSYSPGSGSAIIKSWLFSPNYK